MEDTPSVCYGGLHQVWAMENYIKCELWRNTPSVRYGGLHQVWGMEDTPVWAMEDTTKCELWKTTSSVSYGRYTKCELWKTTPSVSYGRLHQVWAMEDTPVCAMQDYIKCELWKIHQVWAMEDTPVWAMEDTPSVSYGRYTKCELWKTTSSVSYGRLHPQSSLSHHWLLIWRWLGLDWAPAILLHGDGLVVEKLLHDGLVLVMALEVCCSLLVWKVADNLDEDWTPRTWRGDVQQCWMAGYPLTGTQQSGWSSRSSLVAAGVHTTYRNSAI